MLKFLKRDKSKTQDSDPQVVTDAPARRSWRERLKQGLGRSRLRINQGVADLFLGKKAIDQDILKKLRRALLSADVGVLATDAICEELTKAVARSELADTEALWTRLHSLMEDLLLPIEQPLELDDTQKPFVILVVGVNGSGKTTTIAKLAKHFLTQDKKVMLAAGDTFRAAAIEQLQVWGERNHVQVIAQQHGSDSASVVFDAYSSALAKGCDVLIADTAGRLHTQSNLMDELKKIKRVLGKQNDAAPQEVLMVLDGTTGQNALNQVKEFSQAVGVTGLCMTKLDGTAKGGVVCALAKEFGIPLRFIGVGESAEDLHAFNAKEFVEALLAYDAV